MSWNLYLDNLIAQSRDGSGGEHIDKACIIGLNDGAPWTTAEHASNLSLQGSEGPTLATAMRASGGPATKLAESGILCGGVKYMFLRAEEKLALGKKKDQGAITAQKSKTAIVIAHCPEGKQHGNANKAVSIIAEYLEQQGY